jgi:hypothetical protein
MRSHTVGLIALAALILAAIFAIAPRATLIANEISGEVYGIDVAGFAGNADETTPAQRYAKH